MDIEKNNMAKKIKETRQYIGLTQQQVADSLSIPRSAISDIETGKRKLTAEELKKIANLFRHPVNHFLGEETEIAEDVAVLARTAESLSENDRKELLRFAKFLEFQTEGKSSSKGS